MILRYVRSDRQILVRYTFNHLVVEWTHLWTGILWKEYSLSIATNVCIGAWIHCMDSLHGIIQLVLIISTLIATSSLYHHKHSNRMCCSWWNMVMGKRKHETVTWAFGARINGLHFVVACFHLFWSIWFSQRLLERFIRLALNTS